VLRILKVTLDYGLSWQDLPNVRQSKDEGIGDGETVAPCWSHGSEGLLRREESATVSEMRAQDNKGVGQLRLLLVVLVAVTLLTMVSRTSGQTDPLTISMTVQNWDSNMKSLKETTPTTGLVLQFNIENTADVTATITGFAIQYRLVDTTNPPSYNQGPQPLVNYQSQSLVVPNGATVPIDAIVWQPNQQEPYGDYALTVTYSCSYIQWSSSPSSSPPQTSFCTSNPTDVLPYPFEFHVVSDPELQNDIKNQTQGKPLVNIPITINSPLIGGTALVTAVVLIAYYLIRRKKD